MAKANKMPISKGLAFNMVIDQQRYDLLNAFINSSMLFDTGIKDFMIRQGLYETWKDFMVEFSEKSHANNFCKDPDCLER